VLDVYEEDGLIESWCLDAMTFDDVAARIALRVGTDAASARAAMEADCARLEICETTMAFARELGRAGRAAIVTINPDVFSDHIVPAYALDRDFPVIVTSWEEKTLDKVALCEIALAALGAPDDVASALLVDNDAENVAAFEARGGQGYVFTDDATFAMDLPGLRARLA
jgi:hypothetical protein